MSSRVVQFETAEKHPYLVVCGGWCSHVGRHGKPHKVGTGILFWRGNALKGAGGHRNNGRIISRKPKMQKQKQPTLLWRGEVNKQECTALNAEGGVGEANCSSQQPSSCTHPS